MGHSLPPDQLRQILTAVVVVEDRDDGGGDRLVDHDDEEMVSGYQRRSGCTDCPLRLEKEYLVKSKQQVTHINTIL